MRQGRGVIGEPIEIDIESLDLEASGVAHHEGKVVFARGALPGERVRALIVRRKPRFDVAQTIEVLRESHARVVPRCPHFGVCGGCSMQHLEPAAQLAIKQRVLEDQLRHIGKLRAQQVLRPLSGPSWGYRHRARLSARHVPKKGGVLVGFHERGSSTRSTSATRSSPGEGSPIATSICGRRSRRLSESTSSRSGSSRSDMRGGSTWHSRMSAT